MKPKIYTLLAAVLLQLTVITFTSTAQSNQVYWREGFEIGSNFNSNTTYEGYTTGDAGTWYVSRAYRTSGATGACASYNSLSHLRLANNTSDSPFAITPVVFNGINQFHFSVGRAGRPFTIYKTADTLPSTANWVVVTRTPSSPTTCVDTTITVNDVNAKRIKIVGNLGTDSDIDSVWMTNVTAFTMPVTFSNVRASQQGNEVQIDWTTASEINLNKYSIERSNDGRSFSEVTSIAAKGNSAVATNYSWLDKSPGSGTNYYRVKAQDRDGSGKYTSILKVSMGRGNAGFMIAPNPVKGNIINLQLKNLNKGNYTLRLFNSTGQQVYTSQLSHNGSSASQFLEIPALKKGVYNMQISDGTTRLNNTVVVD